MATTLGVVEHDCAHLAAPVSSPRHVSSELAAIHTGGSVLPAVTCLKPSRTGAGGGGGARRELPRVRGRRRRSHGSAARARWMEERVGAPPGHKSSDALTATVKELRRHRTAHLTAHEARDADIVTLFRFADALHNLTRRLPVSRSCASRHSVGDGQAIGVAVLLSSRGAKRTPWAAAAARP